MTRYIDQSLNLLLQELLNALDIPLPTPEPYGKVGKEEEDVDEDDDIRSLDELEIVLNELESQSK